MNSINEKEKKLILVLDELKNLDLTNPELQNNIENLGKQKNQLEIEKNELESKYKALLEEHNSLTKKLEEIKNNKKQEERKQIEFSENSICFLCSCFSLLLISSSFFDKMSCSPNNALYLLSKSFFSISN